MFHHFRIIWNYSKKGKTATLLPWLHTIPCSSPYFSPLFFTATTEGGEKLSTPADSHPFFPSRLFARHFLSLPAGKFSFTSARIRESSTRPRATREARSKKRKGREGRRSGTVIEREREEINSSIDIYVKTHFVFVNGYNVLCLSFLKLLLASCILRHRYRVQSFQRDTGCSWNQCSEKYKNVSIAESRKKKKKKRKIVSIREFIAKLYF